MKTHLCPVYQLRWEVGEKFTISKSLDRTNQVGRFSIYIEHFISFRIKNNILLKLYQTIQGPTSDIRFVTNLSPHFREK